MANRLNTYQILKKIHLYSSIIILVFLLMYVITAFIIVNNNIFPHGKAIRSSQRLPFVMPKDMPINQLPGYIKSTYHITGRTGKPQKMKNGKLNFWISKPGLFYHIVITEKKDTISLYKEEQKSIGRMSSRLHFLRGYSGGIKYNIWSFLYDLSATAMIIFSLTGIYMWWRLRKKYKLGILFLSVGILIPVAVIILLSL